MSLGRIGEQKEHLLIRLLLVRDISIRRPLERRLGAILKSLLKKHLREKMRRVQTYNKFRHKT